MESNSNESSHTIQEMYLNGAAFENTATLNNHFPFDSVSLLNDSCHKEHKSHAVRNEV
jgi:hypothetical protein